MRLLPHKFKDRVTVSLRETSELLGVSEKTIYNQLWVGSCPLPTVTSVEIQGESPLNIPVSFRAIGKTLPDVNGFQFPFKSGVGSLPVAFTG